MERQDRFTSMVRRNQQNKTSEQIQSTKEAVKQAAKDYQQQKQERYKKADELRDKSLTTKYAKKIQTNYRAKKAQQAKSQTPQPKQSYAQAVSTPPPIPSPSDKSSGRNTSRAFQASKESPKTFFNRLMEASPNTLQRELHSKSKELDAVLAADQAIDKGRAKRTATNVVSSSGVDTSALPLTINQHPELIASYEANINDINKIIADIGTGAITKDQKAIINKFLPEFVGSTNAKAKRVQEALVEMEKKLTDAKLQHGMAKVRTTAPMTANPAFEAPKGPISGGGGARK